MKRRESNTMIRRFFRHLIDRWKLETKWLDDDAAVGGLLLAYASVIATIKLSDIQNSGMRKDIQDQSEQTEKEGQTVTNENYHKQGLWCLTAMKHVDKVDF